MWALVVTAPQAVQLAELPEPTPDDGEVLVQPRLVGMCGTDLEIIDGSIDQAYVRMPLTLGHEWSGVVVQAASDSPPVGTRVVVEGIVPCGVCPECAAGNTNRCHVYDEVGFTRPGAAADLITVPAQLVHALAPTVSFESGVLVEPAAVVYRAIDRANPQPGARVLVVGDGTVGLIAACLLRLWRPASVHLLGARSAQQPLATAAGVDAFFTDASQIGSGYDLIVEAAGATAAVEAAVAATGRGGTVVLLGLAGTGETARVPVDDIVNGDVTIIGSFGYTTNAWAAVVDLLNAGEVSLDFLITHRYPLGEWQAAVATLRRSDGVRGKVLLEIA